VPRSFFPTDMPIRHQFPHSVPDARALCGLPGLSVFVWVVCGSVFLSLRSALQGSSADARLPATLGPYTPPPPGALQPSDRLTSTYINENHGVHPTVQRQSASNFGLFSKVAMALRTRKAVLSTFRKRLLIFSDLLAAVEVGAIDKGDLVPGGGRLRKLYLQLCCGLSLQALHKMHTKRYLQRERGGLPKTAAWFKWVFYSASEKQFRPAFRVNRSTFQALKSILLVRARAAFCRRRGGSQLSFDLQLAVTLIRVGHYGKTCSVDAVAELFGLSVGGVIKSTRRVVKALAGVAPQHIRWPKTQRRAGLSMYAAEKSALTAALVLRTEQLSGLPTSQRCIPGRTTTESSGTA